MTVGEEKRWAWTGRIASVSKSMRCDGRWAWSTALTMFKYSSGGERARSWTGWAERTAWTGFRSGWRWVFVMIAISADAKEWMSPA